MQKTLHSHINSPRVKKGNQLQFERVITSCDAGGIQRFFLIIASYVSQSLLSLFHG